MKRAREKAKQKALLKKQLESSPEVVAPTQEPISNIAIAIDPTYSSRRTDISDVPCKYFYIVNSIFFNN